MNNKSEYRDSSAKIRAALLVPGLPTFVNPSPPKAEPRQLRGSPSHDQLLSFPSSRIRQSYRRRSRIKPPRLPNPSRFPPWHPLVSPTLKTRFLPPHRKTPAGDRGGGSLLNNLATVPDRSPSPESPPLRGFTLNQPPKSQPAGFGPGPPYGSILVQASKDSSPPSPIKEKASERETKETDEPTKKEETAIPAVEVELDWASLGGKKKKGQLSSLAQTPSVPNIPDPDNVDDCATGGGGRRKKKNPKSSSVLTGLFD